MSIDVMRKTEVLVVGGGFSGLCVAAGLVRAGADVIVLEALAQPQTAFRGELLHPPGVRALDALGLSGALAGAGAVPVNGFSVLSPAPGRSALLPYPARRHMGCGFEHSALVTCLRSELEQRAGVRLVLGARVESLVIEGDRVVGVRCADGAEYRARLVVAADGRHSRVRKLLGLEGETRVLSHMAVLGVEGSVLPDPDRGHVFLGGPGPILAYPYAPGRVRVCVDVPTPIARSGRKALIAAIRDEYAAVLPSALRAAIDASLRQGALTGCANHAITLPGCASPGIALIGDAGGCSHPLTATGMTTALHDVLLLLDGLRAEGPTDEAVLGYQKRRMRYVRGRELFAQSLYDVFRGADPASCTLRDAVFDYWRTSERARRASVALLTGERASPAAFLTEFGLVAGLSALQNARRLVVKPRASATSLRALLATLAESSRIVRNEARALRGVSSLRALSLPATTRP